MINNKELNIIITEFNKLAIVFSDVVGVVGGGVVFSSSLTEQFEHSPVILVPSTLISLSSEDVTNPLIQFESPYVHLTISLEAANSLNFGGGV